MIMKTGKFFSKGLITAMILSSAILVASCDDDDDDDMPTRPYTISGNANGGQVVPAVTGTGTGTITGTYNPNNGTLIYTTNWNGLTGAPTGGGFYIGGTGTNGAAIGTPWTFEPTATGTGSFIDTMSLTNDQATQLKNGNWYYIYNTTTNPAGEVRGQITATQ